jgi:SAM-dependent methyltransferase
MKELEEAQQAVADAAAARDSNVAAVSAIRTDVKHSQRRAKDAKRTVDANMNPKAKAAEEQGDAYTTVGRVFDADLDDVTDDVNGVVPERDTVAPEYGEQEYWEARFKKEAESNSAFEWYHDYANLKPFFQRHIPECCRTNAGPVLMVGCGNSTLSEQMYDDGYKKVVNIDFSKSVIVAMAKSAEASGRTGLEYEEMDARELVYEDGSFDSAIDKGTMDAVLSATPSAGEDARQPEINMEKICREVLRVLRVGGVYVIISSIPEELYRPILSLHCGRQGEGASAIVVEKLQTDYSELPTYVLNLNLICFHLFLFVSIWVVHTESLVWDAYRYVYVITKTQADQDDEVSQIHSKITWMRRYVLAQRT